MGTRQPRASLTVFPAHTLQVLATRPASTFTVTKGISHSKSQPSSWPAALPDPSCAQRGLWEVDCLGCGSRRRSQGRSPEWSQLYPPSRRTATIESNGNTHVCLGHVTLTSQGPPQEASPLRSEVTWFTFSRAPCLGKMDELRESMTIAC